MEGFGYFAYLIARDFNAEVVGVDKDEKVLSLGRNKYRLDNLKFSSSLSGMFDSMSAVYVVHHLKLEEFKDVLKHVSGKVLIYDFRKVSKQKFKRWYDKKILIGEYKDSFSESYKKHCRWNSSEFKELMESFGFKTIECYDAGEHWFFYTGTNKKP